MSYFRTARNCELSLLYYLEQSVKADWSGITVVKTFASAYSKDVALPIICSHLAQTNTTRLEIGNNTLENRYLMVIDIFATSDGQLIDLADYVKGKLATGWVHYDHSHASGQPATLVRDANGRDYVTEFINDSKIEIMGSSESKDSYRQNISVLVRKSS